MKTKRIIWGLSSLLIWGSSFAQDLQNAIKNPPQSTKVARPDTLHALYSYSDFKYDASTLTTISEFHGHSNLYLLGGNNFPLSSSILAGLFIYRLDTYLKYTQSPLAFTNEVIHNNSFFAHIMKQVKPSIYVDLIGGYGQNYMQFKTIATDIIPDNELGHANAKGDSWFAALKAYYSHSWNDFSLMGNVGVLHTEVFQNPFNFVIFSNTPPNMRMLAAKAEGTFFMENAELTYKHFPKFQPFINAGLIQVGQSTNSQNSAALAVASLPNPNITLDQNGFSVGGGFSWRIKRAVLRLEQQYYQRGTVYHSNQSIASLRYSID